MNPAVHLAKAGVSEGFLKRDTEGNIRRLPSWVSLVNGGRPLFHPCQLKLNTAYLINLVRLLENKGRLSDIGFINLTTRAFFFYQVKQASSNFRTMASTKKKKKNSKWSSDADEETRTEHPHV